MNSIHFHDSYYPAYVVGYIAAGGVDEALAQFRVRTMPDDAIAAWRDDKPRGKSPYV